MTPAALSLIIAGMLIVSSLVAAVRARAAQREARMTELVTDRYALRFPREIDSATVERFMRRFQEAQREPHRVVVLGPGLEFGGPTPRHPVFGPAPIKLGPVGPSHLCCGAYPVHREARANRRTVTNEDGRYTVPGWSESTSDRTLAEYVAAELDRVDPL